MQVSLKTMMPTLALGLITVASCAPTPAEKMTEYLNKESNEYSNIVNGNNFPYIQSKLDSIAYKNIFDATQEAQHSKNVADFNKIASQVRNGYSKDETDNRKIINNIKDYLIDSKISYRNYNKITDIPKEEFTYIPPFQDAQNHIATKIQYNADKWAYLKFFNKIGLMENSLFSQVFQQVSTKIKP